MSLSLSLSLSTTALHRSDDAEIKSDLLTHSLTDWQCHLLSCPGQLKREWSGVPVTHPQQIGRLPELSDVLCPQCKSCWAFDKLIRTEQYYMRLNRTKMIFMYTMCTTHTCDQLSKKCCVNSKEKLNKFHWTVEDCASDKKCIFVALN